MIIISQYMYAPQSVCGKLDGSLIIQERNDNSHNNCNVTTTEKDTTKIQSKKHQQQQKTAQEAEVQRFVLHGSYCHHSTNDATDENDNTYQHHPVLVTYAAR